jgi:hypothetical protein
MSRINYTLFVVFNEFGGVYEKVSKKFVYFCHLGGTIGKSGIRPILSMQSPPVVPPGITVKHKTKHEVPS